MRSTRPRLDPALYVGMRQYFLTFCTAGRRRLLVSHDVCDVLLRQILRTASEFDVVINVHCLMPDHVHLLAEGCSVHANVARFVHQAKQRTGYTFAQRHGTRLWQPSFHDHVLRNDEAVLSVARYIIENPVRAGLVKSPRDYPFVGTREYTIDQILEAACWQP